MVLRRGSCGPEVAELQRQLSALGFGATLSPHNHGTFGGLTEIAVRAYQRGAGLVVDGEAGPITGCGILADLEARQCAELADLRGSLAFTIWHEGHKGYPYKPDGEDSGVTLDPGVDLAHQHAERLWSLYTGTLCEDHLRLLERAIGLRGEDARRWLRVHHWELLQVEIERVDAAQILARIAPDYWRPVASRFPRLRDSETPARVQTALFSLAYNRGARNPKLDVLADSMHRAHWAVVADMVEAMGEGRSEGLALRRRREAKLIRGDL